MPGRHGVWQLRTATGKLLNFGASGKLTRIGDLNGNARAAAEA